ncbi:MarR family transcriptional regulator [Allohahella marinimesophila]|uniref:MarR family transcriptional regulator n=1 Tax=Allohahella marinimesophila TaxID=1054972 RepID=A0ABP7NWB7_9GAMM
MPRQSQPAPDTTDDSFQRIHDALAHRPGFLIRRLHQIHVALFLEECAGFNITPVQYSVLTALRETSLDQKSIAIAIGIDRATMTEVLKRLDSAGWIHRVKSVADNRRRIASLTPAGRDLLEAMDEKARRAHERTIAPLEKAEREQFVNYMMQLVDAGNDYGRATLKIS